MSWWANLCGVDQVALFEGVLGCSEAPTLDARDAAGIAHTSPAIDAAADIFSAVFCVAQVDGQVDGSNLKSKESE